MSRTASLQRHTKTHTPCCCRLLFPGQVRRNLAQEEEDEWIPVAPALSTTLRTALAYSFPRTTPFSLLLLHITQFERMQMSTDSSIAYKRLRYHAPASLLQQVVLMARRTLRSDDQVLIDEQGTGAAFFFPQVDQEGIARITERVAYNIDLLQAETVTPPLYAETEVALGSGSYPTPAPSLNELLVCASRVQERIVFRPAILPQPGPAYMCTTYHTPPKTLFIKKETSSVPGVHPFPFMQIPACLPENLKKLIPYSLAQELRCVPVGRDHNKLTVAMANPADTRAIHNLRQATDMTIFPVACEVAALDTLLASGW